MRICHPASGVASTLRCAKVSESDIGEGIRMAGVLDGVKVIEFGQNLAGPYCGQILAFMGAEVVKIEKPEGDDARKWGPPFVDGDGVGFIALNRGKRSVTVDLNDPAQKQKLLDLCATADVFVHNLRAGVPEKFGIDGASLTARFPRLVYADLSAIGHTGPWKLRPGYEPLIQAEAGLDQGERRARSPGLRCARHRVQGRRLAALAGEAAEELRQAHVEMHGGLEGAAEQPRHAVALTVAGKPGGADGRVVRPY